MRFSNEFKVGLFVLIVSAALVGAYFWTKDGLFKGPGTYVLTLRAPRADGLNEGTAVKLAGVKIGSVGDVMVSGGQAEIELVIDERYELPVDSTAELKATGLLGDYFVMVDLGDDGQANLKQGDRITYGEEPGDLDAVMREVEDISRDIKAITGVLREMVEDRKNQEHVRATLANTDQLTDELRLMATNNRRDIRAIVESVLRLTNSLEGVVDESGKDLDEEFDKIKDATDTLQSTLDNMDSITGKVDRGEGTVGALINDRETVDALNDTLDNANEVIESFSGLQAEVVNWNRFYMSGRPTRGPDGERLTDAQAKLLFPPDGRSRKNFISGHGIGVNLRPQEDFWYTFELIAHPVGAIEHEEYYIPERYSGVEGGDFYREWTVTQKFRYSFMINKRWRDIALRVGVKESSGGGGITLYAAEDRFQLHLDVFDWTYGGYPLLEDDASMTFNTRLRIRYEPMSGMFLEAGTEDVLPGIRYGYVTGFAGAGFRFTDNDIKLLFAALPLNF